MAPRQAVLGMEQASFYLRLGPRLRGRVVPAGRRAHGAGRRERRRQVDPAEVPDGRAGAQCRPGDPLARACASAACRRTCPRAWPTGRCARCCASAGAVGQDDDGLAHRRAGRRDRRRARDRSTSRSATLSGGWQRLMLIAAAARLEEPDILILDEPTNHLDLANINTLERWLTAEFEIPMLIVSHDREFLDRVTERTLFLRTRRRARLQDALLGGARGAAAPRRHGRRARAGSRRRRSSGWSRRPRATRSGRSRTPTSTSARTPSRRGSPASRPSARRPTSRASAGWSSATATSTRRWRCGWPTSR